MNWLWKVALKKLVKRGVQIVVAWITGHNLDRLGITIDPVQLSVAIWAFLELGRDWLKQKAGWRFL